MKNNIRIAALVALGLAGVSAAQASTTDLLLGFNDAAGPSSAQNDYVIDLGLSGNTLIADANGNGGTWNLSSALSPSTFSTAFGSDGNALNDVAAGVVGGSAGGTKYLFQTFPGGNPPPAATRGQFAAALGSAQSPTIGEYGSTSSSGWTAFVATSPTVLGTLVSGDDVSATTGNPLGQLSSGVVSLNLWENTQSSLSAPTGWVDEGTFNINANDDTVTFSVAAVPEPATYGLLSGAGLLVLGLRRQIGLKKA